METIKKTRGVFALIQVPATKCVLLSERADGKGWNLPGGGREEGETDEQALVREVREETGLEISVGTRVGPEHVFKDDTAVAYLCEIIGGELRSTKEAVRHHFCSAEDLKAGTIRVNAGGEVNGINVPLKLVGPEGRLGRTGRMVWDALSLLEEPQRDHAPFDSFDFVGLALEENLAEGVLQALGDCFYELQPSGYVLCWPRHDPYTPNGRMEANTF